MQDEYVEITEQEKPAATKLVRQKPAPVLDEGDIAFAKRMENWRRTVRGSLGGGGGYCAGWARLYVAARTAKERKNQELGLFASLMKEVDAKRVRIDVDELDGWLVEAAVRSLGDFNERKVLQFWYVFQYPEHWIKTKLLLRRSGVMLVKARAENNLQKVFTRLENAATILSNNLHAGVDPRPESKDAPAGGALTLEKEKALSDSSLGAFCIARSPATFSLFPSIFAGDDHEEIAALRPE
jgi:hypothetical protein